MAGQKARNEFKNSHKIKKPRSWAS